LVVQDYDSIDVPSSYKIVELHSAPFTPFFSSPISPVSRQRDFTEKRTRKRNIGKVQYNEGSELLS
jgi:hypothetical protein